MDNSVTVSLKNVRKQVIETPFTSKWKRDVGMAKHFSKKYGNKGWAFDYPVSAIWNQFLFCQDACQCLMLHPYITASSCKGKGPA